MRGMPSRLATAALACLALLAPRPARAQDPAVVNSKTVHVKLDNATVRVLDSTLEPGEKEALHSHPACVVYVLAGGKLRNHAPDGTTTEAVLQTGDVAFRAPVTHWAENIGDTAVHVLLVELKSPAP